MRKSMNFEWGKVNYFATRDLLGIYHVDQTMTTCVVGGKYFTDRKQCENFVAKLNAVTSGLTSNSYGYKDEKI